MKLKNVMIIAISALAVILIVVGVIVIKSHKEPKKAESGEGEADIYQNSENNLDVEEKGTVDIIDINSNSRPYAVVVNNTPVAVKVQEGLNRAYLVYEIPTEGNTSRLLAMYKDIPDNLVIGTIRSARHNFIDFALESDAIFCCFGWSKYARSDLEGGIIDYLQGLYGDPFYRNNPEGLATEHTAYTSMNGIVSAAKAKGMRQTSDSSILLKYDANDIDLSKSNKAKVANDITIPYGAAPNITSFKYNKDTKRYTRYRDGIVCTDHNTKEEVTTKNIIVQKINYKMCSDNYCWDLETVGSGTGFYITNGYATEINWKKESRGAKTRYTYKEGTIIDGKNVGGSEISLSDGNTFIEVQTTSQTLTIN